MPTLARPDDRQLAYEQYGDPGGTPVFFQHGTGDSRLARNPENSIAADLGIRLITVDRPGVGGSTPLPGRTLRDWVPEIAALADALEIDSFAVAGWSGGGPHALALARFLGNRVTAITLACPLGPFDRPGARDLVENKDLRMIWKLSHLKFVAGLASRVESKEVLKDLSSFVDGIAKDAPSDKPVLTDPVLHPMFEEEMGAALAQGGEGVLDDMWAFLDWGFKPEDIEQQVTLFYGGDDEILSPQMYRDLAERLPNCSTKEWAEMGHYSVFANWSEFLGPLGS